MSIEQIRELLSRLRGDGADPTSVTDAQLAEARAAITEQARGDTSAMALDDLRTLRDARAAVVELQTSRAAEATEREGLLSELTEPTPEPSEGEITETEDPAEPGTRTPGEAPSPDAPAPTPGVPDPGSTAPAAQPAAVAASGRRAPSGSIGRAAPAPDPALAIVASTTAAGGTASFAAGDAIPDLGGLARAMAERISTLTKSRAADGERIHVARVTRQYPEAHRLSNDASFDANHRKIEAVTSAEALVAAGGLCAPPQTLYDIEVIGSSSRPIRAALTPFMVERGAIQYRPNTSAAAAVNGVGVWTLTDDAEAGIGVTDPSKACFEVPCPGLQTAQIQAIYQCLEFSNITARYDPESTAANVRSGVIAHTRLAENQLLAAIYATSKIVTVGAQQVGAVRHVLVGLDKILAYYRNRHRIDESVSLTWIVPAWVRNMFRADLAYQMAAADWQSALAVSEQMIDTWLSARGVTPAWHLDGGIGGTNEIQTIAITGTPTGGTFTLTYSGQTTAAIPYNATAAQVSAALQALSNLTVDNITAAGGPLPGTSVTVQFSIGFGVDAALMTAAGSFTGGSSPAVAVTTTTAPSTTATVNSISIPEQVYDNVSAGATVPQFPTSVDTALFVTGTKLFLDGGTLDLGVVRDSQLNARNRYRQFFETFEGVADRGIESLRVVIPAGPSGMSAGTVSVTSG
jgi:hypothetical protein